MGDLVPRRELTKQGVQGVSGVGGGIILLLATSTPILGIIVGALLTVAGISFSRSRGDRVPGAVLTGAGILGILSALPFLGGIAGTLLTIGGVGLLGLGAWKLIQFIINLRKRS